VGVGCPSITLTYKRVLEHMISNLITQFQGFYDHPLIKRKDSLVVRQIRMSLKHWCSKKTDEDLIDVYQRNCYGLFWVFG
jgi:hypothetical protein